MVSPLKLFVCNGLLMNKRHVSRGVRRRCFRHR